MRLRRALLAPVLLLSSAGCVLLTPPIDPGDDCAIAGASACASCLRRSCQAPIDAACNATVTLLSESSPTLDALDTCGSGDRDACVSKVGDASVDATVKQCLVTSCRDECVGEGAKLQGGEWTCDAPRDGSAGCASCIHGKCGTALDECCGDASCKNDSSTAREMGACLAGDAPGCLYLVKGSTAGFSGKLRGCIQENCSTACFPEDGRMHTRCSLVDSGRACTCSNDIASDGPECSTASTGGTCLLAKDGCSCGKYTCGFGSGSSASCSCAFRGAGGETACSAQESSDHCCIKVSDSSVTCSCSSSSCYPDLDEYEVASCSKEDVLAAAKNLVVDACSN